MLVCNSYPENSENQTQRGMKISTTQIRKSASNNTNINNTDLNNTNLIISREEENMDEGRMGYEVYLYEQLYMDSLKRKFPRYNKGNCK